MRVDHCRIVAAMAAVRARKEGFVTNFFMGERRLEELARHDMLYFEEHDGCGFVVVRERGIGHLYFFAAGVGALGRGLERFEWAEGDVVVDLVGGGDEFVEVFEGAGFERYARLFRMVRTQGIDDVQRLDARVVRAGRGHVGYVLSVLEGYFDKRCEQLPSEFDICRLVDDGGIWLIEGKGFVIFEINGQTSYLRYWFVSPEARGEGVGSALLRRFFHECRHTKRQLFWVLEHNADAIAKYRHYGFGPEKLLDNVMIRC